MAKVSAGVVAGIAVGGLIAGVLVCGFAFYIYGRRRQFFQQQKNFHSGRDGDGAILEETLGEKQRGADFDPDQLHNSPTSRPRARSRSSSTSSTSTATIGTIESIDQEVREEFHCLNVAIRGHAELYYNMRQVERPEDFKKMACDINLVTLNNLLGPDAPINAITTDVLLQAPETRHDTIRFLLAWVLFRLIQPDAPIEQTLLPPELVKCAQAMARKASQTGTEQTGRCRSETQPGGRNVGARSPSPLKSNPGIGASNRQPALSSSVVADERLSFAKWRSMSGKLFDPIYGTGKIGQPTSPQSPAFPDPREKNIDQLVTSLVCLLQPYVAKGYGGARVRDLESVVKSAAGFGYKLFTQKTEWEFAWSTLMADEVVVFPALVKVGDDRGHKLRQSIVLTWEETVRLDYHVLNFVRSRDSDLRTIEEAFEEL
ncbi:hypothetical protein BST61_g6557 [Cercospora zeina]